MDVILNRKRNGVLYWGAHLFAIITLLILSTGFNYLVYIAMAISVIFFISSQVIFIIREPMSTFKSKAFLWTAIPLIINLLLNKMSSYFFSTNQSQVAFILIILMLVIGIITIVRKVILKERYFWY